MVLPRNIQFACFPITESDSRRAANSRSLLSQHFTETKT